SLCDSLRNLRVSVVKYFSPQRHKDSTEIHSGRRFLQQLCYTLSASCKEQRINGDLPLASEFLTVPVRIREWDLLNVQSSKRSLRVPLRQAWRFRGFGLVFIRFSTNAHCGFKLTIIE